MARHSHLRRLVERSRNDSFFLGKALEQYQRSNRMDDAKLAEFLACTTQALERLALCRMPRPDTPSFQQDVRQIAHFAPCHVDRLLDLLRQTLALSSLQRPAADSERNTLLAARDRKGESEENNQ